MGFEFDENGKFYEWSPLFDSSSLETYTASLTLPTPKGIKINATIVSNEQAKRAKQIYDSLNDSEKKLLNKNIRYIFKTNPRLSEIGTEEDYRNYLLLKFPESKIKQILWHGSPSNFYEGFNSAERGDGSGAPETKDRNDFYFAKQDWSILQYIDGLNVPEAAKRGAKHWNNLWWELRAIMRNGRAETDWQSLKVDDDNVREAIPNKNGEYNLDLVDKIKNDEESERLKAIYNNESLDNKTREEALKEYNARIQEARELLNPSNPNNKIHGKTLKSIKERYGYEDKTNEQFFKDVFDIKYGEETFAEWAARKGEEFKTIVQEQNVEGMWPAIVDIRSPYVLNPNRNTYYKENKDFEHIAKNQNDGIINPHSDNEFNSDVIVVANPDGSSVNERIWWLGSVQDINSFVSYMNTDIGGFLGEIAALEKSNSPSERALAIKKKGMLIRKLQEEAVGNEVNISYSNDVNGISEIIEQIQEHENYTIPPDNFESCIKNAVVARVQQAVSDPKNIVCAYSPITMEDTQKAARKAPKGELVLGLTGMNPITKFIMQKQNMDGKTGISVCAVGEKIFMGLTYYYNEGLRHADKPEHYMFVSETSQIQGRRDSQGNGARNCTVTKIADVNLDIFTKYEVEEFKKRFFQINYLRDKFKRENASATEEEINQMLKDSIENYSHADLMISQLLSAATDNAKELILSKINASSKLLNIYLHLIILGYSLDNIVNFMTSPAISLVADILEVNRFDEVGRTDIKIKDAIEIALNNVDINDYLKGNLPRRWDDDEDSSVKISDAFKMRIGNVLEEMMTADPQLEEKLLNNEYLIIVNEKEKHVNWKEVFEILPQFDFDTQERILDKALNDISLQFSNKSKDGTRSMRKQILTDGQHFIDDYLYYTVCKQDAIQKYGILTDNYFKDLKSLQNISKDAEETTQLGQFMQMCKEIPTNYAKIVSKIHKFENYFEGRLEQFRWVDSNGKNRFGFYNPQEEELGNIPAFEGELVNAISMDKPYLTKGYITNAIRNAKNQNIIQQTKDGYVYRINFSKFLEDETYRSAAIDLYDLVKDQYNIYDVMAKGLQYLPALKGYDIVQKWISACSIKSKVIESMRRSMKNVGEYLDDKKIAGLEAYAEELLIRRFLREHEYKFPIQKGQMEYNKNLDLKETTDPRLQRVLNGKDIMSFKYWVEHVLFPEIERGKVHIGDTEIPISNKKILDFFKDTKEGSHKVKGLRFSSRQLETNVDAQISYAEAMNSLDSLDDQNTTDIKIKDCLILYNLIAFRNTPGNDRMTTLFNDQISNSSSNLMKTYLDSLGELDQSFAIKTQEEIDKFLKEELLFSEDAAQFNMAPIFSYRAKIPYNVRNYHIRKADGTLQYYKNKKLNQNYGFLAGATAEERTMRLYNYMTDGTLFITNMDESNELLKLIKSAKPEELADVIDRLEMMRKLIIRIKC